jgi:hypothetical protein
LQLNYGEPIISGIRKGRGAHRRVDSDVISVLPSNLFQNALHTKHKSINSGYEAHKRGKSDNEGNLKVTLEEAELESQNVIHCGEATFEKDEDFEMVDDGGESNYFIDATN